MIIKIAVTITKIKEYRNSKARINVVIWRMRINKIKLAFRLVLFDQFLDGKGNILCNLNNLIKSAKLT